MKSILCAVVALVGVGLLSTNVLGAIVNDGPDEPTTYTILPEGADHIQDTIEFLVDDGDVIQLAAGTYLIEETVDTLGKNFTLRGVVDKDGTPLSILNGQGLMRVIRCITNEGPEMLFEYLVITGGLAEGGGPENYGGGMYCHYSNPTLTDCVFTGNSAIYGGGMYNGGSSPTLENCAFEGNFSDLNDGGGLFNSSSSPTLTGCGFTNNSAGDEGGGVHNYSGNPTFTNCTFTSNVSYSDGGGMYNYGSSPTLENCTFENNSASAGGGGMYNYQNSYPTLENCAIEGNSAGGGGGIGSYNSIPVLSDSTVCSNTPDQIAGPWTDDGGNYTEPICTCPGDINEDGHVDGADQGLFLIAWGTSNYRADFNKDGNVDGGDLGLLLLYWGPCP